MKPLETTFFNNYINRCKFSRTCVCKTLDSRSQGMNYASILVMSTKKALAAKHKYNRFRRKLEHEVVK